MPRSKLKPLRRPHNKRASAEESLSVKTDPSLVLLHPRNPTVYTSDSRAVLATGPDGSVFGHDEHGFWVYQCRMLSRYRWLINGSPPMRAGNSNIEQHSWLGYYIAPPKQKKKGAPAAEQHSIELQLSRQVGPGLHEDVTLTNFTQKATSIKLELEVESDFADPQEAGGRRKQKGHLKSHFRSRSSGSADLTFDYHASHRYSHQGDRGTARMSRGIRLSVEADSRVNFRKHRLSFVIRLLPGQKWRACLKWFPRIEEEEFTVDTGCHLAGGNSRANKRDDFLLNDSLVVSAPSRGMTELVIATIERSKRDLAALRLYDLDNTDGRGGWTFAAGVPAYVALFGRDTLIASWQASMRSARNRHAAPCVSFPIGRPKMSTTGVTSSPARSCMRSRLNRCQCSISILMAGTTGA